jgi:alkanesulfonate monooxygenase SsuD/methylene tetrahydromethanopterin reductase-like flavin-dependent oxidoreductase (luciferase family)
MTTGGKVLVSARGNYNDEVGHIHPKSDPGPNRRLEVFYADLRHFELVENLDYDKVRIAEHLFSNCDLVTSTQVYPAAITQRTKRIRINTAVAVVPFNHTPRMTSDFALIDILSQGRLDLGIGRGRSRRMSKARCGSPPTACFPMLYAHHALIRLRSRD